VSGVKDERLNVTRDGLKNGMYTLTVTSNGKRFSRKLTLK